MNVFSQLLRLRKMMQVILVHLLLPGYMFVIMYFYRAFFKFHHITHVWQWWKLTGIVGSVVLFHDITNKTCFSLNKVDFIRTCGFYRGINHHITISYLGWLSHYGKYNQNPCAEYEWDFHIRDHTVALY